MILAQAVCTVKWRHYRFTTLLGLGRELCCLIVSTLISLPFPVVITTVNHKNDELQHSFDFLVIC
jgi:hypothetical protein